LLSLTFDRSKLRVMLFERMARMRLDRGIDLLSTGRAVITDRLHGHILCCLLDIPHVALDNNYGKIRNFSAAWDTAGPRARLASSLDEAVEIAKAWKA
jgi:pyruvyl transferase EpsO